MRIGSIIGETTLPDPEGIPDTPTDGKSSFIFATIFRHGVVCMWACVCDKMNITKHKIFTDVGDLPDPSAIPRPTRRVSSLAKRFSCTTCFD
jgi:hypothetical protein